MAVGPGEARGTWPAGRGHKEESTWACWWTDRSPLGEARQEWGTCVICLGLQLTMWEAELLTPSPVSALGTWDGLGGLGGRAVSTHNLVPG